MAFEGPLAAIALVDLDVAPGWMSFNIEDGE